MTKLLGLPANTPCGDNHGPSHACGPEGQIGMGRLPG